MDLVLRADKVELEGYVLVLDFHYWENLDFYTVLMKKFINGEINRIYFKTKWYYLDSSKNLKWEEFLYVYR